MPDTPLNPDALTSNPELFMVASTHHFHSDECLCGFKSARSRDRTEHIMLHTLAAAQPVAQKITDAEWQAFQAIPDQGYSHRSWVDARIAERVAVAQPAVNSMDGVYDIGSPEPEGVDYVVECDEHGVATDYLCSDAFSGHWSKTTDGTQWKGYQDGKVYMPWAELVRRVGPVKAVKP